MNASPKILIIRLSSLGDILHALPAFSNLRATFPDATIDWLVAKKCSFLPTAVRGIDGLHVLDTHSLLRFPLDRPAWNQFWGLIRELRACRFDCVLDFQGLLKTAFLGAISGSRVRIGFSKELVRERPANWFYNRKLKGPPNQVHVLVLNQMLAELAGARPGPSMVDFSVPAEDNEYVASLLIRNQLKEFVVINPGGGWATKRWNPERYGRLAKRIQQLGLPVAVTTGPGEDGLFQSDYRVLRRSVAAAFSGLIPAVDPIAEKGAPVHWRRHRAIPPCLRPGDCRRRNFRPHFSREKRAVGERR